MEDVPLLIICLSNQFYDSPLKTNKHLVTAQLTKLGHKVLFVDPPTRVKWISQLRQNGTNFISGKKSGLTIYTPPQPLSIPPFPSVMNAIHASVIRSLIKAKDYTELKRVLWVYHFDFPRLFEFIENIGPDILIYDVVDSYPDFPEYSRSDINYSGMLRTLTRVEQYCKTKVERQGRMGRQWALWQEERLAKCADIVFTSHPRLFERFHSYAENVYYLPNAGAFDLYSAKPRHPPQLLRSLKRPIIGYSGALDAYKFDVELFSQVAAASPEYSYVLIGPMQLSDSDSAVRDVLRLDNVHWFGIKTFEETARFTNYFDAYIIPYVRNSYTINGCFPVKLFNALATGIPVVVTSLPAYSGLEDVLYIANSPQHFLDLVRAAVAEDDSNLRVRRVEVAKRNSWENKVRNQLKLIATLQSERKNRP